MVSKTRLPNKAMWAFEDIVAVCRDARAEWRRAMEIAERRQDLVLTLALARLSDDLAAIERLARDGRQGRYENETGGCSRRPGEQ